ICLLPVWLCNGLWHGPAWNYIFNGIYYFIVILAGLALDPVRDMVIKKTGANPQALYWRVPQILKTWVIIFVGELLFRANGLKAALVMYRNLFVGFSLKPLWDGTLLGMNLDKGDYLIVVISVIVVAIVGFIKEKKCLGDKTLSDFKLPVRWIIYLALILAVLTFGAYGIGYSEVDLIYAGF
ncbi:MAG: MBOAT family protein, partial [Lachnospiraceae bacterium]|nr:MBOAT family protein [Candidatus Equihabitans merdae]